MGEHGSSLIPVVNRLEPLIFTWPSFVLVTVVTDSFMGDCYWSDSSEKINITAGANPIREWVNFAWYAKTDNQVNWGY